MSGQDKARVAAAFGILGLMAFVVFFAITAGDDVDDINDSYNEIAEAGQVDVDAATTTLVLWAGTPLDHACTRETALELGRAARSNLMQADTRADLHPAAIEALDDVVTRCADEAGAAERVVAVTNFAASDDAVDELCLILGLGELTSAQVDALAHATDPGNLTDAEQDAVDALVATC